MRARVALLAAAFLAVGAGGTVEAKTFKWAFQGDVQSLDPYGLNETFTLGFLGNIYESLTTYDKDLNLVPGLAESWENVEPTKWIFKLRQGVKFHDGGDFTADDVIMSWQRSLTEGSDMKGYGSKMKAITKIDDYTIEVETPSPNPILPRELVFLYIMDKEWAEAHNTTQATNVKGGDEGNYANLNANGTGPFMAVERAPDVKTVLKRNENYWGEIESNVTEGIFTPIGQDATRVAALIAGDVDMAWPVPVQDWDRLEQAAGVQPLTGAEARTIFLGFDQDRDELLYSSVKGKNPFKDARVRQAVFHAIDIEAIREKVMRGASRPAALMVAPQINGWSETLDVRAPLDLDKATALLTEAGYGEGFTVTMDCPTDRYVNDERICQAVASMLAKIGIKVDLLAQTKAKYFAKVLAQNGYDTSFYLLGWTPGTFDAHNAILNLMTCRGENRGLFNLGGYCNQRVSELETMIASETDQAKRQAMIDEAFKIHLDEMGHIPMHQQPLSWGVSDRVSVAQRADDVFDLRYAVVK
ncbi:MAG: ABC transporter substrate-binding protein [Kiloniellales bacterium]